MNDKRKILNKLTMVQSYELIGLIKAEFAERKETDDAFARYATSKLGFEVAGVSVTTRRQQLGIPGTNVHVVKSDSVAALEARVAALENLLANATAGVEHRLTQLEADLKETKAIAGKVMTNLAKGGR